MERNSFPVEMALGALVLCGILVAGANMSPKVFHSEEPNYSTYEPMARGEVKAQYKKLVEARKERLLKRDGAPAKN